MDFFTLVDSGTGSLELVAGVEGGVFFPSRGDAVEDGGFVRAADILDPVETERFCKLGKSMQ